MKREVLPATLRPAYGLAALAAFSLGIGIAVVGAVARIVEPEVSQFVEPPAAPSVVAPSLSSLSTITPSDTTTFAGDVVIRGRLILNGQTIGE